MKKIILLFLILFNTLIFSQSDYLKSEVTEDELEITGEEYLYPYYQPDYFEDFDVDTISDKFFFTDKMLQYVDLNDYQGQDTSKVIDLATYKQILFQLEKAEVFNSTFTDSIQPYTQFIKKLDNVINESSSTKGVSEFNVLMDIWMFIGYDQDNNSYKILGCFSPIKNVIYRGENINFTFTQESIRINGRDWENVIDSSNLEFHIDFDDGEGYRNIEYSTNSDYWKDINVSYTTTGKKTLTMTVFDNGETLHTSRSFIEVATLTIPDPSEIIDLTSQLSYENEKSSGKLYIYKSSQNDGLIKNPLIFVEGFDLFNNMNADELYNELRAQNLDQSLLDLGYDIIILNFSNARKLIQRNAYLLIEAISCINDIKASSNELIIIGASMGGLVSRYALSYMETNNIDHQTRLWVSFDSPQKGANIPYGIQHWVRFFASEDAGAKDLLEKLNSHAAKQMLISHYLNFELSIPSEERPAMMRFKLYTELSELGHYPSFLKKVAIANGTANGTGIPFNGDEIIYYHDNDPDIDHCSLIRGDAFTSSPLKMKLIFDGRINAYGFTYKEVEVRSKAPMHLDYIPGGTRNTQEEIADTKKKIKAPNPDHTFIPSISSLAIDTQDPYFNINNEGNQIYSKTPFDSIYYPKKFENLNQEHCLISEEMWDWLYEELIPSSLELNNSNVWSRGEIKAKNSIRLLSGYKNSTSGAKYMISE